MTDSRTPALTLKSRSELTPYSNPPRNPHLIQLATSLYLLKSPLVLSILQYTQILNSPFWPVPSRISPSSSALNEVIAQPLEGHGVQVQ